MGQVLHGSARTTAAVRRAIQDSQESLRVLAKRYGINLEKLGVDRTIEHHRRDHAAVAQARDEGGGFPMAVRDRGA